MHRRPLVLSAGLVLLAPTVGEFLLGNIPISQFATVLLLAPLYGAGALLIREVARRLDDGWPTIVCFAAAYALVEEGPVDQMVFNPGYLGLHSFAGQGEILGISTTLVVNSLALHTLWSICVPIAIIESFDPTPARPWLGVVGLGVTAAVFLAGCLYLGVDQARSLHFVGTSAQFAVTGAAIVALVAGGVVIGRRPPPAVDPRPAPRPWRLGLLAFVFTSGYWLSSGLPAGGTAVGEVVRALVATGVAAALLRRWSRRVTWSQRHRLALAAGAAATYALWFGPAQALGSGTSPAEAAVGAVVLGAAMLAILVLARRALAVHSGEPFQAVNRTL